MKLEKMSLLARVFGGICSYDQRDFFYEQRVRWYRVRTPRTVQGPGPSNTLATLASLRYVCLLLLVRVQRGARTITVECSAFVKKSLWL